MPAGRVPRERRPRHRPLTGQVGELRLPLYVRRHLHVVPRRRRGGCRCGGCSGGGGRRAMWIVTGHVAAVMRLLVATAAYRVVRSNAMGAAKISDVSEKCAVRGGGGIDEFNTDVSRLCANAFSGRRGLLRARCAQRQLFAVVPAMRTHAARNVLSNPHIRSRQYANYIRHNTHADFHTWSTYHTHKFYTRLPKSSQRPNNCLAGQSTKWRMNVCHCV